MSNLTSSELTALLPFLPGWTTMDAILASDEAEADFMVPHVQYFEAGDYADFTETGFYCRLSASANGYLDCTEWDGPFQSEAEAYAHLLLTYFGD